MPILVLLQTEPTQHGSRTGRRNNRKLCETPTNDRLAGDIQLPTVPAFGRLEPVAATTAVILAKAVQVRTAERRFALHEKFLRQNTSDVPPGPQRRSADLHMVDRPAFQGQLRQL